MEQGVAVAAGSSASRARARDGRRRREYQREQGAAKDNLWQRAFPFEIELESMDKIYQFNWDFTNLEKTLQEGGELYGKTVYLFVSTEPHVFDVNGELKMVPVPVVVAVDCPFPPSDQIGISIVHTGQEEIVPMKALKMIWEPYVPREDWNFGRIGSLKTKVFVLCCAPRRSAPKRMKSERPKEPLYCKYMPYYPNPHPHEDDATVVSRISSTRPPDNL